MKKRYDVFISYRRDTGTELARIIDSEIDKTWFRAFLDYNELKDRKWGPQLMAAIDSAPVFLFIMSPGALDRCGDENDWVRQEIQYAILRKKHIVPVNPEGGFKEFPQTIPSDILEALSENQHSEISLGQLFKSSIRKLLNERIAPYVPRMRRLRRLVVTLVASVVLLVSTVALWTFSAHMRFTQDMKTYDRLVAEVKELLVAGDLNEAMMIKLNGADSLACAYERTRYNGRLGTEAGVLKDSLFKVCKDKSDQAYKRMLSDKNEADMKDFLHYLKLANLLRPSKGFENMLKIYDKTDNL